MEGVSRRLGRHSFVPLIINLPRRPGRIQRTLYIPGTIIKRCYTSHFLRTVETDGLSFSDSQNEQWNVCDSKKSTEPRSFRAYKNYINK